MEALDRNYLYLQFFQSYFVNFCAAIYMLIIKSWEHSNDKEKNNQRHTVIALLALNAVYLALFMISNRISFTRFEHNDLESYKKGLKGKIASMYFFGVSHVLVYAANVALFLAALSYIVKDGIGFDGFM